MDKVRLILTVISIVIVVVPIVGIVLMYQGNLLGLFIPPQANQIISSLSNSGGNNVTPPEIVGEPQYDAASRTFTLSFLFKNPLPVDVTVKSMSGNIVCDVHPNVPLGKATLSKPVSMQAGETATITVQGTWTDAAISHFQTAHKGEKSVTVDLVDLAVDASGITVQTGERIRIPNVPLP